MGLERIIVNICLIEYSKRTFYQMTWLRKETLFEYCVIKYGTLPLFCYLCFYMMILKPVNFLI